MIRMKAPIEKFGQQGEKTGWHYVHIPEEKALCLNPGNRRSFRVRGHLDQIEVQQLALIPMGEGDYILSLKAPLLKKLGKRQGAMLELALEKDEERWQPDAALMDCLSDEPRAYNAFTAMPLSHQRYFSNFVQSAKQEATQAKRIAMILDAMLKGWNYAEMIRAHKKQNS